jgi:hypothetical protein
MMVWLFEAGNGVSVRVCELVLLGVVSVLSIMPVMKLRATARIARRFKGLWRIDRKIWDSGQGLVWHGWPPNLGEVGMACPGVASTAIKAALKRIDLAIRIFTR